MRQALLALLLLLASFAPAAAAGTIRVAFAGSMGVVMDQHIGPQFAKQNAVAFQGVGQGSYTLARLIAAKRLAADVFIAITPGPIEVLVKAGLISQAVPVASTAMVIAYAPKSRFATEFAGQTPWWKVLESRGLKFGRTDPKTDPQGRNIVFTMLLAERYYHQPELAQKILGAIENSAQIFTEPSILSRLQAGQLDASSGYESAVRSLHLPFVALPEEINLSNPAMAADWYSTVHFTLTGPDGKPHEVGTQPLVFYAAALRNAHSPKLAQEFLQFLLSPAGQAAFSATGYNGPNGGPIS